MLNIRRNTKGQGISAEYALLLVLVAISIAAMSLYVRRMLQARYRDVNRMAYLKASYITNNEVYAEYEPYYVNTLADTDGTQSSTQRVASDGGMNRETFLQRTVNSISGVKPY